MRNRYHQPNNAPPAGQPQTFSSGRYGISRHRFLDGMYNTGPLVVAVISFIIALVCLLALEIMDIIVGKFTAAYMLNDQYSWLVSAGTTGMVIALIGTVFYGWRERWSWKIMVPVIFFALIPAGIDVLFDAMAIDILKFGHFINPSVEFAGSRPDILMYNLYRLMIGALSAIGEPLVAASVMIFPIMREIFKGVFQ